MRKTSKLFLTFLLFVLGTYGERIFQYVYTLLVRTPPDIFVACGVLISAIIIIILSSK